MTHSSTARRRLDAPTEADSVAEAVRRLNHALQDDANRGDWPPAPADAYRIAGALAVMAGRLPNVLRELTGIAYEPEGLRIDDGTDPHRHLAQMCAAIGDAQHHAAALEAALNLAWQLLGHVAYAEPAA